MNWISIKDKLPPDMVMTETGDVDGTKLILIADKYFKVCVGFYLSQTTRYKQWALTRGFRAVEPRDYGITRLNSVEYWMPIPEVPKAPEEG